MGMNKNQLVNTIALIIASINLGGLPFTFGYLYKFLFLNFMIINPINMVSFGLSIVGLICGIIYVFKIIYYSCFDFRKGFIQTIFLLLQNNFEFYKKHILSFTFAKYVAFFILYVFSIFFFFINKCYILNTYMFFFYQPNANVSDYNYLTDLLFINNYWAVIYYSLFIVTFMTLLLMNWRTNYFFIEKLELNSDIKVFTKAKKYLDIKTMVEESIEYKTIDLLSLSVGTSLSIFSRLPHIFQTNALTKGFPIFKGHYFL